VNLCAISSLVTRALEIVRHPTSLGSPPCEPLPWQRAHHRGSSGRKRHDRSLHDGANFRDWLRASRSGESSKRGASPRGAAVASGSVAALQNQGPISTQPRETVGPVGAGSWGIQSWGIQSWGIQSWGFQSWGFQSYRSHLCFADGSSGGREQPR